MGCLKVLDVTLRDGGCVNNFNFGQNYMDKILSAQEASGVDVIELGYIDNLTDLQNMINNQSGYADAIANALQKYLEEEK